MASKETPNYITGPRGGRIAYHKVEGEGPAVVFLGGLMSDMGGTKALYLDEWALESGRAFLRFDYSGHGASDEAFTDGTIGAWAADARHAIETLTDGPQILVGSSMGGWISSLLIRAIPERIAGFVGIAAAPDFTEDSMWAQFSDNQKAALETKGVVHLPSDYGDPYPITKAFIEDGRDQLVLRSPLKSNFPVRLLQGSDDTDVLPEVAQRLFDHIEGDDVRLTIVKGSDHRFSNPTELGLIRKAIHSVTQAINLSNEGQG